jgi:hypothetical protein
MVLEEPQSAAPVAPGSVEFLLHGHHQGAFAARLLRLEQLPVHRAVRAACADQVTPEIRSIDLITISPYPDLMHAMPDERRAAAFKQEMVEFNPADGVLAGWQAQAKPAQPDIKFIQDDQIKWILIDPQSQVAQQFRCHPAGTWFKTRKSLSVQHQAIHPMLLQPPGAGRSGRPSAHQDDVFLNHGDLHPQKRNGQL